MARAKQKGFENTNWKHRFSYGGSLRNSRAGRRERPLSRKDPIHLVFKANRETIPGGFRSPRRFRLIHALIQKYAVRFFVKVEQLSIQGDHLHLVIRMSRRSHFQHFMRVVSGQVAQRFLKEGLVRALEQVASEPRVTDTPAEVKRELWKHRPFTRVVKNYRAYRVLQDYVQLNEQEVLGKIPYRKERLRGLEPDDWENLWT